MLIFFVLTFAVSWTAWLAASQIPAGGLRGLVFLAGTFAPGFVALGLTPWTSGSGGVRALLHRLFEWEVPARWYLLAVSYIAVIKMMAAVVHRVLVGAWPPFGDTPLLLMLAATVGSTLVGGQSGEELGWRGYALPRLASRFGLGGASVLLGVVWAAWHLPFFYLPDADTSGQSFPLYLLQVTALSVALAWVYARTQGSLVPVMLFHAAVNNTKDIVPSAELGATRPWALSHSVVGWTTVALLWLFAAYFLLRMRRLRLPDRDEPFKAPRAFMGGVIAAFVLVCAAESAATQGPRAEAELRDLEQRLAQAWVTGDRAFIEGLLAADWTVTDPSGQVLTRDQVLTETFTSTERKIERMAVDDVRVRLLGTTAVVTGRTRATGSYRGQSGTAVLRFTDVFVHRDGRWQVVASQGTAIPP